MSDETQQQGASPAEGATTEDTTKVAAAVEGAATEGQQGDQTEGDAGAESEGGTDGDGKKREPGSRREKRRVEMLRTELAERDRRIEELERRLPSSDGGTKEQPPKEEDFQGDYFAFQTATAAYNARQAVRDEFRSQQNKDQDQRVNDLKRERVLAHQDRVDEARETITDFDEVIGKMKGVNVHDDVIDEIMASDKSALLAYHLAKNPETLRRLNGMGSRELAREIGRLEGSIRMPAAKRQTTTPPPGTPLKPGGAAPAFDPRTAEMAEYAANYAKRKAS